MPKHKSLLNLLVVVVYRWFSATTTNEKQRNYLKLIQKKEKGRFFGLRVYARFLTASTITTPTTRIAIIMAAVEPRRYMSVFDVTELVEVLELQLLASR